MVVDVAVEVAIGLYVVVLVVVPGENVVNDTLVEVVDSKSVAVVVNEAVVSVKKVIVLASVIVEVTVCIWVIVAVA